MYRDIFRNRVGADGNRDICFCDISQAHRADKIFQETVQLSIKTVNEIMEMNKKQIERVEEEVLSMQEVSDDNAN